MASLLTLGALLPARPLDAAVITLPSSGDVTLIKSYPNQNYGAAPQLWVRHDQETSFIRFDLSGLNATELTSLTFGLYFEGLNTTSNLTIFLRTPGADSMDWVEGTGPAHPQTAPIPDPTGSSTWNNRIHNTGQWSSNVGGGGSGASATGAQITLTSSDAAGYLTFTFTDPALLTQWLDAGEVNLLLFAYHATPGVRAYFTSREGAVDQQPYLNVTYEAIPEPGTTAVLLSGGLMVAFGLCHRKNRS